MAITQRGERRRHERYEYDRNGKIDIRPKSQRLERYRYCKSYSVYRNRGSAIFGSNHSPIEFCSWVNFIYQIF